jgi:hypothetical protein
MSDESCCNLWHIMRRINVMHEWFWTHRYAIEEFYLRQARGPNKRLATGGLCAQDSFHRNGEDRNARALGSRKRAQRERATLSFCACDLFSSQTRLITALPIGAFSWKAEFRHPNQTLFDRETPVHGKSHTCPLLGRRWEAVAFCFCQA